ncbi:hypothetical protein ACLOJK_005842 [Asimina triloba]
MKSSSSSYPDSGVPLLNARRFVIRRCYMGVIIIVTAVIGSCFPPNSSVPSISAGLGCFFDCRRAKQLNDLLHVNKRPTNFIVRNETNRGGPWTSGGVRQRQEAEAEAEAKADFSSSSSSSSSSILLLSTHPPFTL